jgi:hypothetical protein
VKPSEFNFERTDFESKEEVIEHFLEGEIVAKLLVLEQFRAGDDSVIREDIKDAADLLWMMHQDTYRPSRARNRRKVRHRGSNVTQLNPRRRVQLACVR